MSVRMGYWAGLRLAALSLLALGSCITPTLPPDEPPAPEVELGAGVARLHGHIGVGPAFVMAHDRASGLVFGERTATGAYDFEVRAEPCDVIAFWYMIGNFESPAITFRPAEIVGPRGACSRAAAPASEGTEPSPSSGDAGLEP